MTKEQMIAKLTSRKFWVAVAGIVSGVVIIAGADDNMAQAASGAILELGSIVTYIICEMLTDRKRVEANENQ